MKLIFNYTNDRIAILKEGGFPLAILTEDETNNLIELCLRIHEERIALYDRDFKEFILKNEK